MFKEKLAQFAATWLEKLQPWISETFVALQIQGDHLYAIRARKSFLHFEILEHHIFYNWQATSEKTTPSPATETDSPAAETDSLPPQENEKIENMEKIENIEKTEPTIGNLILERFPDAGLMLLIADAKNVIVRSIPIPNLKQEDVRLMIPLAIENLLNLPLEEIEVIGMVKNTAQDISASASSQDKDTEGEKDGEREGSTSASVPAASASSTDSDSDTASSIQALTFTAKQVNLLEQAKLHRLKMHSVALMTPESVALCSYLQSLPKENYQGKNVLQIHLENQSLTLNLLQNGNLQFTRTIPFRNSHEELAKEVTRTIFVATDTTFSIDTIFGSGAKIMNERGVKAILENSLGQTVYAYPHLYDWQENMDSWISLIGLAQHYTLRSDSQLNFLSGKFGAHLRGNIFEWRVFQKPMLAAASCILLFLFTFLLQVVYEQRQINHFENRILDLATRIPALRGSSDISLILNRLQNICQQQNEQGGTGGKVLNLLYELTQTVPATPKIDLEFRQIQYNKNGIELNVVVESIGQANELETKLKQSNGFASAELLERKLLPPKQRVQLRFLLKTGSSEGKADEYNCQIL